MAHLLHLPGVRGSFVVGLSWYHEPTEPNKKTKRKRSSDLNLPWAVVCKTDGNSFQSGFCAPVGGLKPADLSPLAAIVADAHPQPWHGIFQLDDHRYWYVAVRDNHGIIPEGDRVGTFEEVQRVFDRHKEHDGWAEHSGTLHDLAQLVQGKKDCPTLRDVQVSYVKPIAICCAILVAVGGVSGGVLIWRERKAEEERQAALARQRAIEAALAAQKNASSKILPWTQQPMPGDLLAACARAWHNQPLSSRGWVLENWHCRSNMQSLTVEVHWKRNGGVAADAPGVLLAKGDAASSSNTIPIAFPSPSSYALSSEDAQRSAWSFAQQFGVGLNVALAPAFTPLPGAEQGKDAPPPDPWIATPADVTSDYAPWLGLTKAMEAVPGLRIADVAFDAPKGTWTSSGMLYGLRGVAPRQAVGASPGASIPVSGRGPSAAQGGVNGHP